MCFHAANGKRSRRTNELQYSERLFSLQNFMLRTLLIHLLFIQIKGESVVLLIDKVAANTTFFNSCHQTLSNNTIYLIS